MERIKLSFLDLLPTYGERTDLALTALIAQAQLADRLGFERYWVTEHHKWCADSSPETLLPLIAATTRRIKVGTAGLLMNYHRPYKVARTFQVLENLFSGRIDLGICRGGIPAEVVSQLCDRKPEGSSLDEFSSRAEYLFDYLRRGGEKDSHSGQAEPWLLGAGSATMQLAVKLKTSYCHSLTHSGCNRDPAVLAAYHQNCQANSGQCSAVLIAGICAPSIQEANDLRAQHLNTSLELNVVGTPGACADQIHSIAHQYGVQRIVWLDLCAPRAALQQSITLLADAMELNG